MLLSVVVPCFNEEASVERLHAAVTAATAALTTEIEIVFVDDGSDDGTLVALRGLAARTNRSSTHR
ncbi:glycosyltransferase [Phytohabitans flavus]|nr:glycosyltransferase [Phytohabitans flavus]